MWVSLTCAVIIINLQVEKLKTKHHVNKVSSKFELTTSQQTSTVATGATSIKNSLSALHLTVWRKEALSTHLLHHLSRFEYDSTVYTLSKQVDYSSGKPLERAG